MIKWCKFFSLGVLVVITGCDALDTASNQVGTEGTVQQTEYPAMAVPLQPNVRAETNIAKLTQLLAQGDLKAQSRAQGYLERGRYYDNMGLRDLARIDYFQSLDINPAQPEVFNLLGMYYTQIGQFDTAYQAFDSTIELDPSNLHAVYNRAIALYYGGRVELALEDMKTFYDANPEDPFRVLWMYIMESEQDKISATENLRNSYSKRTDDWGWMLVGILLNEISEDDVSEYIVKRTNNNVEMAQLFTEAYFYLGKSYMAQGDMNRALCVYKLAISLNVFDYNEHSYSLLELDRIARKFKQAKESGDTQEFVRTN